ncbi:hypothetical protein [Actinoplanes sp. NPDC049599]|uniref:hypothetical protein n=1 Tax=Actinoplanes sp. NPDC049599 TaxID=3363903 RepID=UPI0037944D15
MHHQGFLYSATEPAVRAVTALLAAGRAHPDTVDELIGFLGSIAQSVVALRDDEYFAVLVPDLSAAVAEAYPVVLPTLESTSPEDALMLAECLVAMARIPLLADRREQLAVLIGELRSAGPPESQPHWVRLLASLGVDVRADLDDADPAVRLRAALACEPDPAAREIILAALAHPAPAGTHRSELVAAAIRVASGFPEIADSACAVVARASWTGAGDEWGELVRYAFAGGRRPRLTDEQRALLRALVANPDLWDPMNGTVGLVYTRAGLPFDRESCRRLAEKRREAAAGSDSAV